ncbi:MAG: protease family protein [Sphingomonadales bacterium]|jgi:hypothetical protein|nr:protease family protein [Sphingomonadales bacterium]
MSPIRKTLSILGLILFAEAIPLAMTVAGSRPGALLRLYGFEASAWPAWLLGATVALGYILYSMRAMPLVGERMFAWHWLKLLAIPFAIVTGTFEELWFRKMVMDWAAGGGASALVQVALSAAVFGAAHGIWGLFARQWRVALGAALSTAGLGALLAIVYLAAGRQVAPCIWSHLLINLAIEPWLILAAVSMAGSRRGRPGGGNARQEGPGTIVALGGA